MFYFYNSEAVCFLGMTALFCYTTANERKHTAHAVPSPLHTTATHVRLAVCHATNTRTSSICCGRRGQAPDTCDTVSPRTASALNSDLT